MRGHIFDSDRAVSDLVGFVLTFAIIIASVSFVYVAGFDALGDIREREGVNTADRAMQGVAETLEDIHREGVPSRSIELGVDSGELDVTDSDLRLEVKTDSGTTKTYDVTTNALVFSPEQDRAELVYESGALFRNEYEGSIVRHRPVVSCTSNAAIISVVSVRGELSTSGSVQLTARQNRTSILYPNPQAGEKATDATKLTVDVSPSSYEDSWSRHFSRITDEPNTNWVQGPSDSEFACEDVDQVYIRKTTIDFV